MPLMMAAIQIFACTISDLKDKNKEANKKAIKMAEKTVYEKSLDLHAANQGKIKVASKVVVENKVALPKEENETEN